MLENFAGSPAGDASELAASSPKMSLAVRGSTTTAGYGFEVSFWLHWLHQSEVPCFSAAFAGVLLYLLPVPPCIGH